MILVVPIVFIFTFVTFLIAVLLLLCHNLFPGMKLQSQIVKLLGLGMGMGIMGMGTPVPGDHSIILEATNHLTFNHEGDPGKKC